MQQLRDQTGDSASFAVLSGSDILYITHVSTYCVIRTQAATGTRFPALATSLGRAILSAHSDGEIDAFLYKYPLTAMTKYTTTDPASLRTAILEARTSGFSMGSDQLDYGITSIACPVVIPSFGVIDLSTSEVETPELIVDRVERALPYIDKERLVLAPDCGMKYLPREVSLAKLEAMVSAAKTLRKRYS